MTRCYPVLTVLAGGCCVLTLSAAAAVATAGAASSAAGTGTETDLVTLSPFVVNTDRDTGYQAVSSLAGGRIDTPLDRTPGALSILTREFLDDIGANNFVEAALWSPNSAAVPANPESSDVRIDFRSTANGSTPSVNYFTFAIVMDSFSTERIEFARGPNSILFGQGNLSGFATVNLKQPRFRNFSQVQFRFDNFETRRASIDFNRQLLDGKAAIRFAALHQDGQRWRKPNPDDRTGYFLAATVKLGASAVVRFEGEYGTQRRTFSEGVFLDNASAWTGTPYPGRGTGPPVPVPPNSGMQGLPPNADFLVFNLARPERGVLNYRGFARTTGTQNLALLPEGRPYIPNFPTLPGYGFDFQPPNNLQSIDYYFATLHLEKQFGPDFFIQLSVNQRSTDRSREGANWTALRRDPNSFLPNGDANPDFGRFYLEGEPTTQAQTDTPRDYRLLATYRFENAWMQQRVSGYAARQRLRGRAFSERLVRTDNAANPSPATGSNFIQQRYYFDGAATPFAYDPAAFRGLGVRRYRFSEDQSGSEGDTAQLATVGSYFGGKLSTILGYRYDDTDRFSNNGDPDPVTGTLVYTRRDFGEAIGTTTAGAVWYPIPAVGPFVNYSESFSAVSPGEPLLNSRQQPDVPRGDSREYGLYFKLLQGRVQGSLRYYDSVQHGRIVNAPGVPSINAIWQALGRTENVEVGAKRDTQTLFSTGYEFELTANLTKNWRTMVNFSVPRSQQGDSFPETIAYRARFLSQWQAAVATNPTIASNLQSLDAAIANGTAGRGQNTQLHHRGNFYSSYDFSTGRLAGFEVGAGANVYGDQIIGNVQNEPFNYIYSPGYTLGAAHLGYSAKWRNVRYRLRLNVTNLFDRQVLIYTNAMRYNPPPGSGGTAGDYPGSFRYVDPRKITLTTTFDFL